VALREKRYGIWRSITWTEYGDRAEAIGLGLASLGVNRGDRIALCSENRPEWLCVEQGTLGIGAVSVGIYTTSAPKQIDYIVNDCMAKVYFAENQEQLYKCLEVRETLKTLSHIIVIDPKDITNFEDSNILTLDDLMELGRSYGRANPNVWCESMGRANLDDLAILIYTSGTTGPPKGAMITHRNILFEVETLTDLIKMAENDELFSFLPLSHVVERLLISFCPLASGSTVNFSESLETVPENLREVSPTVLFGVPRVWEKLYSGVILALANATTFENWAYRVAINIGHHAATHRMSGNTVPLPLRIASAFLQMFVLNNIKRVMGLDRARLILSGAAPISPDLIRWYHALGLDMREGYGQTENTGVATFHPQSIHAPIGTVGSQIEGTYLRLGDDGEVLLKGPHVFMGYLGMPDRTAETIRDGWLHTGDIGELDDKGNLRITDRKSDIIITAGGKNITPSEIENQLKFSPFISDAVIIGERRPYLTCLIMIDHDNVANFAQDNQIPFTSFSSLTRAEPILQLVANEIEQVNGTLARAETIKKFALIETEIGPEDEEVTPTMKLKRKFVNDKYVDVIDTMYQDTN